MAATAEPPALAGTERPGQAPAGTVRLEPAAGVELLGHVHGCGYRDGACLVRRADGQIVQLGTLLFALLECLDGRRGPDELAQALSEKIGRRVDPEHVIRLAQKLAQQGLLVGTEHLAPAKRNPLLAMRFKVLVTNQKWTKRLTAPFAFLFSPWIMLPTLLAFAGAFWFVLIHKGVASATAQAFHKPGLLLLVFALAVASAGVHELGHAAACKYGGATPGGMGMGLYLVWPAFYTDVTDTYRLPKRSRLRVDLAGLYFNALISVLTMIAWLIFRVDALLLLVALQVLQMVKQLSPVIRADGYHILSDLTGVPDLFSHLVPTVKRLLPAHRREPSALSGRARLIVTLWVLIIVPVLAAMMIGAILVLPHIATTAWDSGRQVVTGIPREARHGQILDLLAAVLQLFALVLPVIGSVLITQKVARMAVSNARSWSANSVLRRAGVLAAGTLLVAALAWAWWPAGQYNPVRASQKGTLATLASAVTSPVATAHPAQYAVTPLIEPGRYLAVSMTPAGGATAKHPAFFVLINRRTHKSIAILGGSKGHMAAAAVAFPFQFSGSSAAAGGGTAVAGSGTTPTTSTPATVTQPATGSSATGTSTSTTTTASVTGGSAHDNIVTAVGTQDNGVTYDVGYSLVTVTGGQQVNETNSAVAKADCNACTTVAVAFQVVLIVGQSNIIDPIDTASSLNVNCPSCSTTAYADQIVVTLKQQPSQQLLKELNAALSRLGGLAALGANGTPAAVASYVAAVQSTIDSELVSSGLLANTPTQSSNTSSGSGTGTSTTGGSQDSTGVNGSNSSAGSGGSSSGSGSSTTANGSSGSATGSGGAAGSQSSNGSSSTGSSSSGTTSGTSTTGSSSGATDTSTGSATTTTSTGSSVTSTSQTGTSTQPSGGGTSTQPPDDTTTTGGGTPTGTTTSASQLSPTGTTTTGSSGS